MITLNAVHVFVETLPCTFILIQFLNMYRVLAKLITQYNNPTTKLVIVGLNFSIHCIHCCIHTGGYYMYYFLH